MLKQLSIFVAVFLVMAGGLLYYLYRVDDASSEAEAIADVMGHRATTYARSVEYGDFDYDREQAVLSAARHDFAALPPWAVRSRVKEEVTQVLAEAAAALERAKQSEKDMIDFQRQADEHIQQQFDAVQENLQRHREWNGSS